MTVSGLCTICETAPARHACERCGALVCDDHYHGMSSRCIDCAHPGGQRL